MSKDKRFQGWVRDDGEQMLRRVELRWTDEGFDAWENDELCDDVNTFEDFCDEYGSIFFDTWDRASTDGYSMTPEMLLEHVGLNEPTEKA